MKILAIIICTIFFSSDAHAADMYRIRFLPAEANGVAYYLQCSMERSPCFISFNAGTSARPKILKAKVSISKNISSFEFFQAGNSLSTDKLLHNGLRIENGMEEPAIVDLYKPYTAHESPIHLVVRPPPKFIASLQISLTKNPGRQ